MWNLRKRILSTILLGAAFVVTSQAAPMVRHRMGFGMSRGYWGPSFGYGYGYGYGPWAGGYYGLGGGPVVYNAHPDEGQLKFDTKQKDARVYIDGGYAGEVRDAKGMWLQAGNHEIQILGLHDGETYAEQVYVAAGKTLHVRPGF